MKAAEEEAERAWRASEERHTLLLPIPFSPPTIHPTAFDTTHPSGFYSNIILFLYNSFPTSDRCAQLFHQTVFFP